MPPHAPFLPPEPYMQMFDSSEKLTTLKAQLTRIQEIRKYLSEFKRFPADIVILRARYDEFIRFCDEQFKDFIMRLDKGNRLKNTVVILSSDHGESFEHNYFLHAGGHLYEQVTSIPLIIKEPSQTDGRIINDLVEQIDIPATILELAGIEKPPWMEGRSLYPLLRGKKLSSIPVLSMAFPENPDHGAKITKGTIAVWKGDYKLIHYLEEDRSLLFNLREDPDELNNLFDKEPEIANRLLSLIRLNLEKANERIQKGE